MSSGSSGIKKVGSIGLSVLCIVMLFIASIIIIVMLMGYRIYAIETPSMQESYPVNSVILVKSVRPEAIGEGDVITFVADQRLTVITHRVMEIHKEPEPYFVTKGDSNASNDSFHVRFENVIGKVSFCVPYLGIFVALAHKTVVKVLMAAIICLVVLALAGIFIRRVRKKGEHHEKKEQEADS